MPDAKRVFISYAHKDVKWLEEFLTYLAPYERNAQISVWTDRQINPGEKWDEAIAKHLASADIGVLLVTPDYLASSAIVERQMPVLLKKQVFWIAVRDSPYQATPLDGWQCANDPNKPLATLSTAKRGSEWSTICRKLIQVIQVLGDAPTASNSQAATPIPGPSIQGTVNVGQQSGGIAAGVHIENYYNNSAPPPATNRPTQPVAQTKTPCIVALTGLDAVELSRRIDHRLSFEEVKLVWFETFGDSLAEVRPNDSKSLAIREMVVRAEQRGVKDRLLAVLCVNAPHVANP